MFRGIFFVFISYISLLLEYSWVQLHTAFLKFILLSSSAWMYERAETPQWQEFQWEEGQEQVAVLSSVTHHWIKYSLDHPHFSKRTLLSSLLSAWQDVLQETLHQFRMVEKCWGLFSWGQVHDLSARWKCYALWGWCKPTQEKGTRKVSWWRGKICVYHG